MAWKKKDTRSLVKQEYPPVFNRSIFYEGQARVVYQLIGDQLAALH